MVYLLQSMDLYGEPLINPNKSLKFKDSQAELMSNVVIVLDIVK